MIEVDGDASIGGMTILADYFPWSNGWRVSGGLLISNTEISGTFDDGDTTFDGKIGFKNDTNPMITTGYVFDVNDNWSLGGELGLIFGKFKASSDSMDASVIADIDDLADLPGYPYLAITAAYRF